MPFFRGASTHVYEVARNLTLLGDEVHVLSRRLNHLQRRTEVIDGIMVHRIYRGILGPIPWSRYADLESNHDEPAGLLRRAYEAYLFSIFTVYAGILAASIIHRHGVDVVIERETSFGAGAVASALTGVPLVLEVIGPRYSARSLKRASTILAYTELMVGRNVENDRVLIVDAAVDAERFRPDADSGKCVRRSMGLHDEDFVVGYVGTFQPWHGVDDLLLATRSLVSRIPHLRLLLVGPYYDLVKRHTKELGLTTICRFAGPVPYHQVCDYVNACNLLVAPYNPSKSMLRRRGGIGSPLKVLEYMACGKPVITSAVKPVDRLVHDGKEGLLIPPGDPEALCSTIQRLIKDPTFAEEIGQRGRRLVENHYSWKRFASNLHSVLERVMTQRL